MFLKVYKPINSSLRFKVSVDKKKIFLKKFKQLFFKKRRNNSGRNNTGQITIRHKGSGNFNYIRNVDWLRLYTSKNNFIGYDFDNKHTAFFSLIKYLNGNFKYVLAANDLKINQQILTTFNCEYKKLGDTLPIGWIQNGSLICNLENKVGYGGNLIRAAGTYGVVIYHREDSVLVKLPSKQKKYFSKYCFATIGRVSNILHFLTNDGNAGTVRKKNIRPTVRGETMNPIDHPMGGRTRGGKPTKNPWGKIVK